MHYTNDRIVERKLEQLQSMIFEDVLELPQWETRTGMFTWDADYTDVEEAWSAIRVGDRWECRDFLTRWFRTTVTVPPEFAGKPLALDLEFGGETSVKVNGELTGGLSSWLNPWAGTRTRVYLTDCAEAGTVYNVEAESMLQYGEFSHMRKKGATSVTYTFRSARLVTLDPIVEGYYFDIQVAFDSMKVLRSPLDRFIHSSDRIPENMLNLLESSAKDPYYYERVKEVLITSLTRVDFDFDRARTVESIREAAEIFREKMDQLPKDFHFLIKFVGQAHIDTAWLWPVVESVRKTRNTFSNVCDLMDRYPEFTFAFSQPQLFEFVKDHYPKLHERVKEKVAKGQLELVGNTWVEMDTNIPSGESLVRQILYGRQFFLDEFGHCSDVFWMPDVFGYSWALPQIIKRSGMKYFFTSKLINNDDNRFPHSLFRWKGIDGTTVPAYLQRLNYNGNPTATTLNALYQRYDQKDITDEALMTFGYGDGGGGPTYQMLESARRLQNFPGLPRLEMSTSRNFFESVEHLQDKLPVWNDEMYYEFHRGTYTTQANVKKNNRKGEFLYRQAEMMNVFAGQDAGTAYPYEKLLAGYKKLLTNQFHDIMPGSSINPVYREADKNYEFVLNNGRQLLSSAAGDLMKHIPHDKNTVVVFNFLSWPVDGLVEIPGTAGAVFADGKAVPSFREGDKLVFQASQVPPMGYRCYQISPDAVPVADDGSLRVTADTMENRFFKITLDANGNIDSIFDKRNQREVLLGKSNVLKIFEDKPGIETAWNIDIEYQNKEWALEQADSVEVLSADGLKGVIRTVRSFNKSRFTQDIVIYRDSDKIDFFNHIDWFETEKMLKAEFNVDILSPRATYEIQFGAIQRTTHENTSWDRTKFEACGHKWADLSEGNYGVSLLNDCKYGYDIKDSRMRLTLLRSSIDPDPVADRGTHDFVYSLYPHQGNWIQAETVQAGYELNCPLYPVICGDAADGNLPTEKSYFASRNSNVIIDTVKAAEADDGIILRVYEATGTKTNACLDLGFNVSNAIECNLVETEEAPVAIRNGQLNFTIKPFEVKTFKLN